MVLERRCRGARNGMEDRGRACGCLRPRATVGSRRKIHCEAPVLKQDVQKAATRWMTQNMAILPMAYGGMRQAHAGWDIPLLRMTGRASAKTTKTDAMNKSCPSSTPTLKKS